MNRIDTTGLDKDTIAQSVIEGRTQAFRVYRRLSSSGYRNTLSGLLRGKYNPLKAEGWGTSNA